MKVALYARVSTVRQAENELSIPDQLNQLRSWVDANGHLIVGEYVEAGASATDDKRPVFQQMINDALQKPKLFDDIVIYSLSRFFRDGIQFGLYERKLKKNNVKVVSITQPTSDDTNGEMMRRIINTFDEYQSKENAKHTSRAMKENARQGFFNGSRAPYGYDAVETEVIGRRGRNRKKLAINQNEAAVVKNIFDMYLHGVNAENFGCKKIAMLLNEQGLSMRGNEFATQKIHNILANPLYAGEYYYNVIDSKTKQTRPPEEWVKTEIPAIIDMHTFEQVKAKRDARSPARTPASRVASPTLLSGLIKCGVCGSRMTLATGKSGQYKYYKCTNRARKGNAVCNSKNLPLEKTNEMVVKELCAKVFEPTRLHKILTDFRKQLEAKNKGENEKLNLINNEIKIVENRQKRLLEAIETGVVDLDDMTQSRMQDLKHKKAALEIERAKEASSKKKLDLKSIRLSQVKKLSKKLTQHLLSENKTVAKGYLNLLVQDVVVNSSEIQIKGGVVGILSAAQSVEKKMGTNNLVPTSIDVWRPRRESNARPSP